MRLAFATSGALLLLAACTSPQKQPSQEQSAPAGHDTRPATLRLEASTSRAAGFAGCNRFSASYTLAGDSLRFGPVIATKMACADGDELERGFLGALPVVATYEATDSVLILKGPGGPLARFHAR